jgi:peptidoglycan DL-endopeptidase CwlO
VPSYVSHHELPAIASPASASSAVAGSSRKVTTRIAALMCAGAAAVTLSACGGNGSGTGSRAVAIASQQAGEPYVYGAAGPNSFDCSGFTQYVYGRLGVGLPRTAAQQANAVRSVPRSSARPGDLIFIGSPAYHVGIYAGGGRFWTAPKPGDVVRLQPIWSSNYRVGRP